MEASIKVSMLIQKMDKYFLHQKVPLVFNLSKLKK